MLMQLTLSDLLSNASSSKIVNPYILRELKVRRNCLKIRLAHEHLEMIWQVIMDIRQLKACCYFATV